jgi:hypothetical protein
VIFGEADSKVLVAIHGHSRQPQAEVELDLGPHLISVLQS